ncbi:N-acetyltransferase [Ktedonosporobacter rubrisoli]|uniref:N-acetyltransferase n=1 Tax=Ktedonosporobacter rubrisoli TaxID=2509675 RepID=A0A4P6JP49_KTERU|nr:GNAT family N-acetyltransferase [Ktedonosporobacter rubrisoli]QBD76963.1 N-acetyltransferase [Ktedonosporobacter rubrisoli]
MSQENLLVREARLDDSRAIAGIIQAVGWSEQISSESLVQMQAQVADRIEHCLREDNHTILVAERITVGEGVHSCSSEPPQGIVVGYVAVHWFFHLQRGSDGYVSELFLHPDETGHGIGSRLLDAVSAYAHRRGCTQLILVNRRIRESYRRHFYAKHGWEEQPESAFFALVLPEQNEKHQHACSPVS